MNRPNVIVIVSDTYRPDHIAANGHPRVKTPELDAWLARTITFEHAMVSSFPTIPMRTDWFTGRFGHPRHGWRDLDPKAVTLPGVLRKAGYTTQLLADTTHMLRCQFWRPFHSFSFLRGHEGDRPLTRLNDPVRPVVSDRRKTRVDRGNVGKWPTLCDLHAHTNFRQRYEDESHCGMLADTVCRWIEDNCRGGPFMLWADFFDVHEPWFPPRYLLDLYHPGYRGEPMAHPNYDSAGVYTKAELEDLRARYTAMCTLLSKSVGRIFRLIEDTGLLENTIVLFMSDHGMYLGEHGRTGKSLINPRQFDCFPFYREITNICWSMHIPPSLKLKPLPRETRLNPVVQAPDLMPTILELCGVAAPKEAEIEGVSLVPLLTGKTTEGPREVSIAAGHMGSGRACRKPTVTDGRWTLLIGEPPDPTSPELYDNLADPSQQHNVIGSHRGEAERLHRKLLEWLKTHGADAPTFNRLSAKNAGLARSRLRTGRGRR